MITEVGAVKVRGGEVLGEFQTLVNPHTQIPPFIAVLTGITNSMVERRTTDRVGAPGLPRVRGRLRPGRPQRAVRRRLPPVVRRPSGDLRWPAFEVLDTAKIARRVITRDDAPNCKLSSLARVFHASTTPNHRALSDARATVDVLHGLMERLGGLGVHTLEELQTFSAKVSTAQRRKRHLAEGLPHAPGVYLFRDERPPGPLRRHLPRPAHPRPLLLHRLRDPIADGRDGRPRRVRHRHRVRDTRSRRRSASYGSSPSTSPATTAARASRRRPTTSSSPARPGRACPSCAGWSTTTPTTSARSPARRTAEKCLAALHETFPLRQCTQRLARHPRCRRACSPRWAAVCRRVTAASTPRRTPRWCGSCATTCSSRPDDVVELITRRMATLADDERFEEAGVHRDRLAAFVRAVSRTQRLTALTRIPQLVAARREDDPRGWSPLGGARRTPRPAGGGRGDPAGRATPTTTSPSSSPAASRSAAVRVRRRPPPPRRPSGSCAGWRRRACG